MNRLSYKRIKISLIIFLGVIFVTAIYIVYSTIFINENIYRKYAWDYSKHDKSIINWDSGLVEKVYLSPDRYLVPDKKPENISRILLQLNGNQAVKVTFNTKFDALLGPCTIYINPFIKQVIGLDIRD